MVSVVIVYNHVDPETTIDTNIVNEDMVGSQPIEVSMDVDIFENQDVKMD